MGSSCTTAAVVRGPGRQPLRSFSTQAAPALTAATVRTAGQGDFCRTCAWNDLMAGQCLQCYTADGTSTLDDCDALRGTTAAPAAQP